MVKARQTADWDHTAALLVHLNNLWSKRSKRFEDFHPMRRK